MAIYSKLSNVRKLTNSSLNAIIDVSNLNFTDIANATLEFLNNVSYNEETNSINNLFELNTNYINISEELNVTLNGVSTFKIDSQGRAEGNSFLVQVAEAKRYRHTDFPNWPDEGIVGEIIYTGIQNYKPEFGEDFIGYLDGRGWVSLTQGSNITTNVITLETYDVGSPPLGPPAVVGSGLVWVGPPGMETSMSPSTQTLYFTDEHSEIFNLITGAWEVDGIDAVLKVEGNVLPNPSGTALNILGSDPSPWQGLFLDNQFRYSNGSEANNYVLTCDEFGNATWAPSSGGGGGGCNGSFAAVRNFVATVPNTITHSLDSDDIVVQLIDTNTGELIEGDISNYTANTVDITLTATINDVKIVVLSAGGGCDPSGDGDWVILGSPGMDLQMGVPGTVLPWADDFNDLGEPTLRWKDIYLGSTIDFLTTLDIDNNGTTIIKVNADGAEFESDMSASYNDRSIVDKEYVDQIIGAPASVIDVFATGDSDYNGTASTPIGSYSEEVIYIVEFQNNNISTSPQDTTLEIDGLGAYSIEKGTINGFEPIEPNDIIAAISYYLQWDGVRFQFFTSSPDSSNDLTYTNLNQTTATIGGIQAGSTFNNQTIKQMFDALLYPYQMPSVGSLSIGGQGTSLEVGDTIIGGNRTFTWATSYSANVAPNTMIIKDVETSSVLGSNLANDFSELLNIGGSITKTAIDLGSSTSDNYKWNITGLNSNNGTLGFSTFTVTWKWRRYVGKSTNIILNESEIEALSVNSDLATSLNGSYSFAGGGGDYKFFCIPETWPQPTSFISGGFPTAMADGSTPSSSSYVLGTGTYKYMEVSVTNSADIPQTIKYRVYRTLNTLNGPVTVIVS